MVVAVLACAPAHKGLVTYERPTIDELLAQLDLTSREYTTASGLAKMTYVRAGKKTSASQVVIAEYPDRLRLETLGLFGSPALIASTDGEQAVVLVPGEGRGFVGPPDNGFLQKITGIPLLPRDIVAIVLLRPEILSWQDVEVTYPADGQSLLVLKSGRKRQELEFDQYRQLNRVSYFVDQVLLSSVYYDQYETGFPQTIGFSIPGRGFEVRLNFSDLAVNVDHKQGLFSIVPPTEYRIETIPDH